MKLLGCFVKLLLTHVELPEKGCTVMKHTAAFQSSGCKILCRCLCCRQLLLQHVR